MMKEILICVPNAISRVALPRNNGSPLHYAEVAKSYIHATSTGRVDGGRSISSLAENLVEE